ncbi:tyrosine-type recombinase/integrase [Marinirhabdus gelatinilytica]|uniref:Site-specific recombinase XerD n=1 Tax=Marinirhabdus gelatinilytica TaxID=1703343 RepID=A0A370QLH4_9FLAO|nr:tyrosine-type recombinase/integrase [Marinirhabdus gelatinilytica]RDK89216.1 site-specific recombinase XerD [Marinirhabdus gelatinilytica]
MASIKIVRRKNKERKDGTAPLALRISENYKTNYKFTGQYVLEKDWDKITGRVKRTHPNSKKLNNFLLKKLTEANDIYFDSKKELTTKQVKQKLKGAGGSKSFFTVASERVKNKYEKGIYSVAKSELSILYNLEEFLNLDTAKTQDEVILTIKNRRKERVSKGRKGTHLFIDSVKHFKKKKSLKFQDISESFLDKYKDFCTVYLEQKNRTITNQLIFIRTLFNKAIKDGVVDVKYYPFGGEKEKIRISSGHKIGLTIEEVERLEIVNLDPDTSIWHTKNVWLVAFYFAGVRISDAVELRWSDFIDERLIYTMDKNEKPVSLKIPEKAAKILELYKNHRDENNGYVFPFLKEVDPTNEEEVFKKKRNATKLFNKYLKRLAILCNIDKNLSNHIARHTFGNIAGDKIHPLMLQKLYRHSDLKTTLNYQANFIHKDADDALDSVVNF